MAVLFVIEIRRHSGIHLHNFSAESSFENIGSATPAMVKSCAPIPGAFA